MLKGDAFQDTTLLYKVLLRQSDYLLTIISSLEAQYSTPLKSYLSQRNVCLHFSSLIMLLLPWASGCHFFFKLQNTRLLDGFVEAQVYGSIAYASCFCCNIKGSIWGYGFQPVSGLNSK